MKKHLKRKRDMLHRVTSLMACIIMVMGLLPVPAIAEMRDALLVVEDNSDDGLTLIQDSATKLENFVVAASVTSIESDEKRVLYVNPDTVYELNLTFAERDGMQLSGDEELTYTLPDGFEAVGEQHKLVSPLVVSYKDESEEEHNVEVSVDTIGVYDGILRIVWDGDSPSIVDRLKNAEFVISISGMFAQGTTTIPFATADDDNCCDAADSSVMVNATESAPRNDESLIIICEEIRRVHEYENVGVSNREFEIANEGFSSAEQVPSARDATFSSENGAIENEPIDN